MRLTDGVKKLECKATWLNTSKTSLKFKQAGKRHNQHFENNVSIQCDIV